MHDLCTEVQRQKWESLTGEELSKEKAKVFSYPKHELIEKHMKDLKLLDRAVLPGITHPFESFYDSLL